jgi:hypothetical protein
LKQLPVGTVYHLMGLVGRSAEHVLQDACKEIWQWHTVIALSVVTSLLMPRFLVRIRQPRPRQHLTVRVFRASESDFRPAEFRMCTAR